MTAPTEDEVREYLTRLQGTGGTLAQAQAEALGKWFDEFLINDRRTTVQKCMEILSHARESHRERVGDRNVEGYHSGWDMGLHDADDILDDYIRETYGYPDIPTSTRTRRSPKSS